MDELLGILLEEMEAKYWEREKRKAHYEKKEQVGINLLERRVKRRKAENSDGSEKKMEIRGLGYVRKRRVKRPRV